MASRALETDGTVTTAPVRTRTSSRLSAGRRYHNSNTPATSAAALPTAATRTRGPTDPRTGNATGLRAGSRPTAMTAITASATPTVPTRENATNGKGTE